MNATCHPSGRVSPGLYETWSHIIFFLAHQAPILFVLEPLFSSLHAISPFPSRLPRARTAAFSPGPLPWCSRCSSRGSTTFDPAGSGAGRRHPVLRAVILDRAQISVRRLGAAAAVRAAELQRNPPGRAPTPAAACRGGEVEDGSHSPSQVRYFFTIYSCLHGNMSSSPNSWFLFFLFLCR